MLYQSLSSILCWDMVNVVLRVWLQLADTGGRQKNDHEWDLQEASIKVLRCGHGAHCNAGRPWLNVTC